MSDSRTRSRFRNSEFGEGYGNWNVHGSEPWTAVLTPQMREDLQTLHQINPWAHTKILLLFGIWFGLAFLAISFDILLVQIPAWILIGFVLHGLGVFMHEGAHEALFRSKLVDRTVGFLCGLPVFFSCSNYRATHVLHHRYENTDKDPDNLNVNFPIKVIRGFVYYTWYVIGMPVYIVFTTLTGPWRAEGRNEKIACRVETALLSGFHGGLFYLASRFSFWDVLLEGWIFAIPFAVVVANVRGLAEHTMLWYSDPPHPLKATRTTLSNALVSFFFNNQNYHLEHHLFPGVPWYNLPRVYRVLRPVYAEQEASIARGYLQYVAGAFRYGPSQNMTYSADHRATLDLRRDENSVSDVLGTT